MKLHSSTQTTDNQKGGVTTMRRLLAFLVAFGLTLGIALGITPSVTAAPSTVNSVEIDPNRPIADQANEAVQKVVAKKLPAYKPGRALVGNSVNWRKFDATVRGRNTSFSAPLTSPARVRSVFVTERTPQARSLQRAVAGNATIVETYSATPIQSLDRVCYSGMSFFVGKFARMSGQRCAPAGDIFWVVAVTTSDGRLLVVTIRAACSNEFSGSVIPTTKKNVPSIVDLCPNVPGIQDGVPPFRVGDKTYTIDLATGNCLEQKPPTATTTTTTAPPATTAPPTTAPPVTVPPPTTTPCPPGQVPNPDYPKPGHPDRCLESKPPSGNNSTAANPAVPTSIQGASPGGQGPNQPGGAGNNTGVNPATGCVATCPTVAGQAPTSTAAPVTTAPPTTASPVPVTPTTAPPATLPGTGCLGPCTTPTLPLNTGTIKV